MAIGTGTGSGSSGATARSRRASDAAPFPEAGDQCVPDRVDAVIEAGAERLHGHVTQQPQNRVAVVGHTSRLGTCAVAWPARRCGVRLGAMVHATDAAREALREDEALVFDWHRVAICCAAAGEVSLRRDSGRRLAASPSFRRLDGDVAIYAHRMAYPHLVSREVTVDCRRRAGLRRFVSDLPSDFGLRASLGRV